MGKFAMPESDYSFFRAIRLRAEIASAFGYNRIATLLVIDRAAWFRSIQRFSHQPIMPAKELAH
jgi:hypothetical protein